MVVVVCQNTASGVELTAIVTNSKNGIQSVCTFDSPEAIIAKHGKYVPYWLHIDGVGVLTRIVDRHSDYKKELLMNVDSDDFFFTSVTTDTNRLVSFVRKSVAGLLLNKFEENKLFLIGISCGFAPVGILTEKDETVSFDFKLSRQNNQFSSLERMENSSLNQYYQGNYISQKEWIALAISDSVVNTRRDFESELNEQNRKEYKEYAKFKNIGVASVVFILIVVLGNYFYLNHLNHVVAEKEAEIALNNSNLSLLDKLAQEEIRKKQLAVNSAGNTPYFVSYYLDEIGKSVPEKIRLLEMYVFPLAEKLKEKRKVEVDKSRIEVTGWTYDNIVLDDWIEKLERQDWIKSVELINYHQNDDEAEFKIIIFLPE